MTRRVAPEDGPTTAPSRALKVFGSILAPTTVLAALLFYFGTQHANGFCSWFGVHHSVLGLSVSDYLIRAADGMVVPLTAAAAIGLAAVWSYRLLESRLSPTAWRNLLRRVVPAMVASGLGLVALGIVGLAVPSLLYPLPGLPGLSIAVGIVLLPLADQLHQVRVGRRPALVASVVQWTLTFVLVTVGPFLAVTDYSTAAGEMRGYEYETRLGEMADTAVFAEKDLGIRARGVRVTPCGAESAYRYRYDGLVLVLQSGDTYFLLPREWNRQDGIAVVLPASARVRVEFAPNGTARDRLC
ncbi:MAG: hypothetical protein ACRDSK_31570 [Actinophytocola sp.]|uniref:hypothetical protein n=1 Tax=Actinophytocola sp. TaxID=1872138 RepID=UPI003D6B62B6